MPNRSLHLLSTTVTEASRPRVDFYLAKHRGNRISVSGNRWVCAFEEASEAFEAACGIATEFPRAPLALTSGVVALVAEGASGEALTLVTTLESAANPAGELLASEGFVRALSPGHASFVEKEVRSFRGIPGSVTVFRWSGSLSAPTEESRAKEMFDFARVEQERALEASMIGRKHVREVEMDDPIPFAVEPKKAIRPRGTTQAASLPVRKEEHPATLRKVLGVLFVFVIFFPAVFLSAWWVIGVAQRAALSEDDEVTRQLERSEVLSAMSTKRPPGATASQIARGTYQTEATLLIESSPPHAEVFVDERRIASLTPVRIGNIEARVPVRVLVKKAGYRDSEQLVSLLPSEEKKVFVRLKPLSD